MPKKLSIKNSIIRPRLLQKRNLSAFSLSFFLLFSFLPLAKVSFFLFRVTKKKVQFGSKTRAFLRSVLGFFRQLSNLT